jgi:hypothetical protein
LIYHAPHLGDSTFVGTIKNALHIRGCAELIAMPLMMFGQFNNASIVWPLSISLRPSVHP